MPSEEAGTGVSARSDTDLTLIIVCFYKFAIDNETPTCAVEKRTTNQLYETLHCFLNGYLPQDAVATVDRTRRFS